MARTAEAFPTRIGIDLFCTTVEGEASPSHYESEGEGDEG